MPDDTLEFLDLEKVILKDRKKHSSFKRRFVYPVSLIAISKPSP